MAWNLNRKRKKTATLLQMEAVECGAAALGMILEYYGRYVPLAELRVECGVSRDGVKAGNMLRAARKYGLEGKGLRTELEAAQKTETPFIVFWNFNHFLVVEGFDDKRKIVYLNDPGYGHRTVSYDVFDESYTGVLLSLRPGPSFEKGGEKPRLFFSAVAARIKHTKAALLHIFLCGALLTIPGLLSPALSRVFLDHVMGQGRIAWLRPVILTMVAILLFRVVISWFKSYFLRRLGIHLSVSMSCGFFWHLLRLPSRFYSQRASGEIAMRQGLNASFAEMLTEQFSDIFLNILMMIFYGALMFYYNVRLTLLSLLFCAINAVALRHFGNKQAEANMRLQTSTGNVTGMTIGALQAIETLKASGQESAFFNTWSARYTQQTNQMQELFQASQILAMVPALVAAFDSAAIFAVGGLDVIDGTMTVGALIAFTTLSAAFTGPLNGLLNMGALIQNMKGSLTRIDDVLSSPIDALASKIDEPINEESQWQLQLDGNVSIRNLTFGYSPVEAPIFQDLNIEISAGQKVAFVGGSGSGKTTLESIICGLYHPWSGAILFDGHDRSEVPRSVWVNSFSAVGQEITLFEGTVRENLTLWDATIPDEFLVRACEDAAILDVVLRLPGGFDAKLTEGGTNLSGGQRQRLEIARALVQNPTILLLDEATSALDAETEKIIVDRLALRGCTCIIVAHRLSTIRDCDQIFVFSRGKLVETGTHIELWERKGAYAEMIRADEKPTTESAE